MAHRGCQSSNDLTVSHAEIAILANCFAFGFVHTAESPTASKVHSLPSNPGISHKPILEIVVIPGFNPIIICPANRTSPVV